MKKKIKSILFVLSLLNITVGILVLLLFSDGEKVDNTMVPGEIIVQYKYSSFLTKNHRIVDNGLTCNDRPSIEKNSEDFLKENHFEIKSVLNEKVDGNIALLQIKDNKSIEDSIKLLYEDSNVRIAEPNYIYQTTSSITPSVSYGTSETNLDGLHTNDPLGNQQWNLKYINWPRAYLKYKELLEEAKPIVVGVIDDGVNYNHVDLFNSMRSPKSCILDEEPVSCEHGYDFHSDTGTPLPHNGRHHGTIIAGVIAASINNGKGIIGINPYAKIAALKNMGDNVNTEDGCILVGTSGTHYEKLHILNFAMSNGIKIINLSQVFYEVDGSRDLLLEESIKEFGDYGGLIIVAAGNDSKDVDLDKFHNTPCTYDFDNIICVTSFNSRGNKSSFSNYGLTSVDIAAPGENILTTTNPYNRIFYEDFHSCNIRGLQDIWHGGNCSNGYLSYSFSDILDSPKYRITGDYENIIINFNIYCNTEDNKKNNQKFKITILDDFGNSTGFTTNLTQGNIHALVPNTYKNFSFRIENFNNNICQIYDVGVYSQTKYGPSIDKYSYTEGTSVSAPHVAGLVSLIWMLKPELTPLEVKNLILENGDDNEDFKGITVSGKTINVKKTLDALGLDVPEPVIPSGDNGEEYNKQENIGGYKNQQSETTEKDNNGDYNDNNQNIHQRTRIRDNFLENRHEDESNDIYNDTHFSAIDTSWYSYGPTQEIIREGGYTREKVNAFNFAKSVGITTTNSIDSANMEGELTRIALSKMISHFAINVVGLEPDISRHYTYNDVSSALNDKYNNGPLLSYQLGIMGINVKRFRPYDAVTRAEFATVLSRMIYKIADGYGNTKYYEPHINKLKQEGILTNTDPNRIEKRGLAMLMLLRVAINNGYIKI